MRGTDSCSTTVRWPYIDARRAMSGSSSRKETASGGSQPQPSETRRAEKPRTKTRKTRMETRDLHPRRQYQDRRKQDGGQMMEKAHSIRRLRPIPSPPLQQMRRQKRPHAESMTQGRRRMLQRRPRALP
jgi:hypothetical protein